MDQQLLDKYKSKFVFKTGNITLSEAESLLSSVKHESPTLETVEMKLNLSNFIEKQKYLINRRNQQENEADKARADFDYYHSKLKELGVKVVQPGIEYNGQTDYLHITYYFQGDVIWKWRTLKNNAETVEVIKKILDQVENTMLCKR